MLSIIIPCQEDGVLLVPTLKSIFRNQFSATDFEVLLIRSDNVRVTESVNYFSVRQYSGVFKGQAQALNWGLDRTRGDIICTTKPGCIVASNWLEEIALFFQRNPHVDGVGGPVLPYRKWGTKIQMLASEIFHEEQQFPESVAVPEPNRYQASFHATNSAFRKEIFTSTRFDESLIFDYDIDLCWKLLRVGARLVYNPEMKVQYIFPLSLRAILWRYYVWGCESIILRKRHSLKMEFKAHLYPYYNMFRSLLEPTSLVSSKKMLRFVQHAAFNFGRMRGYGLS